MSLRGVTFLIAVILWLAFLVSLFVYKRGDVSWLRFFIAGPMTVFSPSRYLRADKFRVPPILFCIAILMSVVAWFASWLADN